MDSLLETVHQEIRSINTKVGEVKQDLAAAKEAGNGEQETLYLQLLLSLSQQLSGLQEEENILLRGQAPGKHWLELVGTD